jgi:hypothetical protein
MNIVIDPKSNKKVMFGTVGEVYPICWERQKDDTKRLTCVVTAECEHQDLCYISFQRKLAEMFEQNPTVDEIHLTWSDGKRKMVTHVGKNMVHTVFEIKEDVYNPVEQKDK